MGAGGGGGGGGGEGVQNIHADLASHSCKWCHKHSSSRQVPGYGGLFSPNEIFSGEREREREGGGRGAGSVAWL